MERVDDDRFPIDYAKIVQTEWNAKQKTKFFVFIPEVPPIFDFMSKFVQTEWNAKQKTNFFAFIPEVPPIFDIYVKAFIAFCRVFFSNRDESIFFVLDLLAIR